MKPKTATQSSPGVSKDQGFATGRNSSLPGKASIVDKVPISVSWQGLAFNEDSSFDDSISLVSFDSARTPSVASILSDEESLDDVFEDNDDDEEEEKKEDEDVGSDFIVSGHVITVTSSIIMNNIHKDENKEDFKANSKQRSNSLLPEKALVIDKVPISVSWQGLAFNEDSSFDDSISLVSFDSAMTPSVASILSDEESLDDVFEDKDDDEEEKKEEEDVGCDFNVSGHVNTVTSSRDIDDTHKDVKKERRSSKRFSLSSPRSAVSRRSSNSKLAKLVRKFIGNQEKEIAKQEAANALRSKLVTQWAEMNELRNQESNSTLTSLPLEVEEQAISRAENESKDDQTRNGGVDLGNRGMDAKSCSGELKARLSSSASLDGSTKSSSSRRKKKRAAKQSSSSDDSLLSSSISLDGSTRSSSSRRKKKKAAKQSSSSEDCNLSSSVSLDGSTKSSSSRRKKKKVTTAHSSDEGSLLSSSISLDGSTESTNSGRRKKRATKPSHPRSLKQPEKLCSWQIQQQNRHRATPPTVNDLYWRRFDGEDDDYHSIFSGGASTSSTKKKKKKKKISPAPTIPDGTQKVKGGQETTKRASVQSNGRVRVRVDSCCVL